MPDRIIRDELLESERWLSLKDNADRLAYVALLLRADSLGDFSAEPFRLLRLWRDFGINTTALVSKTLTELADHDLIRLYQADVKPYLHIPRFQQRTRYIKRVFPLSPWATDEQKQAVAHNSPVHSQSVTGCAQQKGSEVKGSEVKRRETNKATPRATRAAFELPEWVPQNQWDAWLEARTKRRNPPTEWAKQLVVRRLEDLRDRGYSPALVLAESALNGWAGVFPPKEQK